MNYIYKGVVYYIPEMVVFVSMFSEDQRAFIDEQIERHLESVRNDA